MDKSSRRPPPPPPGSTLPPVPPPPREPTGPPLPKRNQAPPSAKETLDAQVSEEGDEYLQPFTSPQDFYEDMSPPKVVSPAPHRKYGSTQQPVGLLGGLVHVTSSENDQGKKKNTFLDSFRCLESKLQFNKPDVPKGKSSFLDKDRKISEPMRSLLPFSVEKVRRSTVGESTQPVPEISDDTYEIPEVNKTPEPRLPPRPVPGANTFARPPPPESDSDDGEWDEDWDDAQTDHKQGEELYIEPDGGHVEDDPAPPPPPPPNHRRKLEQIQQPNALQPNSKVPPLTPPNKPTPPPNKLPQMPMAAELKEKFSQFQSSKPIPLPKTDKKPQPPAKPVENKPQLPPRGHEKLPPVPPIDTTDSKSDDNSSAGSSSSGPTSSSKSVKIVSPTGPVIRNQAKKIEEGLSKVPIRLPNHEPPESDEIYDDAITEKLTSFDWFHGELDRKEAEKRVNQMRDNGAFLVRASTKGDPTYPYVLVVISEGKIKNLQLRQRHDKRFAIGNYKEDEVSFTNVPDLVNHHKSNNIKLADGGTVMLTRTPRK